MSDETVEKISAYWAAHPELDFYGKCCTGPLIQRIADLESVRDALQTELELCRKVLDEKESELLLLESEKGLDFDPRVEEDFS